MERRGVGTLFAVLLCLTSLGVSGEEPDGPRLLRGYEFGLNFGAGKLTKKIYSEILIPQVRDAKVTFGAELEEGEFGLCIDGKKPGAFGFVTIQREFRIPTLDAARDREPRAEGFGDGYRAQVLVEARLTEVSTGNVFGMERDIFNQSGQLDDFVFVGFTPNLNINGFTAFANHNGSNVGSVIDLPDAESAGILFDQRADGISAYVRRVNDTSWSPILEIIAPQSEISFLGFGASSLQKQNSVYFRDFHAKGFVNGEFEQPILRDVTSTRWKVKSALGALELGVPDFPNAESSILSALDRLGEIELALTTQPGQFQGTTQVDAMLRSLGVAEGLLQTGHSHVQASNADRARVPLLRSLPVINHIFASGAGFKIKKPKEKELLILVRPTNIVRLE